MTRSAHLNSPSPDELRALLDAAGWTAYAAAPMIGVTQSALAQAIRGETRLRGTAWRLLQILASQSARNALPAAPLP